MSSFPRDFSLTEVVRLAGGAAEIARIAEARQLQVKKWAIYKWGKTNPVKPDYHDFLAELANLPVAVVTAANDRFKSEREDQRGIR